MFGKILCLCFLVSHISSISGQKVFIRKWNGYVADTLFHQLVKSRGYDLVGAFDEFGHAKVMKKKHWGLIDLKGNELTPIAYSDIHTISWDDDQKRYYVLVEQGKYFLADSNGAKIIQQGYDSMQVLESNPVLLIVKNGNLSHVIDLQGKKLLKKDYDEIQLFQAEPIVFKVKNKEYYGLLDASGKILIPIRYHEINAYHNGYAAVSRFLTEGIVYKDRKKIIPVEYDDFRFYGKENLAVVEKDEKFGLIDMKGKWILEPTCYHIEFRHYQSNDVYFVYREKEAGCMIVMGKYWCLCDRLSISSCSREWIGRTEANL